MVIRLSDGTRLLVRHIRPTDKRLLTAAWEHLSEDTRRKRFLAPKPRLTSGDLRYLTEVDGVNHVALVVLHANDWTRPVAVGRFVRMPDDPDTAEVAVTVDDDWQGHGIGKRVGLLLADEARSLGIKRFSASILTDNKPALKLMEAMSERLERHTGGGVSDLVADLAA
jgi:RimJ/RimL family protein N-acetyltransferase